MANCVEVCPANMVLAHRLCCTSIMKKSLNHEAHTWHHRGKHLANAAQPQPLLITTTATATPTSTNTITTTTTTLKWSSEDGFTTIVKTIQSHMVFNTFLLQPTCGEFAKLVLWLVSSKTTSLMQQLHRRSIPAKLQLQPQPKPQASHTVFQLTLIRTVASRKPCLRSSEPASVIAGSFGDNRQRS